MEHAPGRGLPKDADQVPGARRPFGIRGLRDPLEKGDDRLAQLAQRGGGLVAPFHPLVAEQVDPRGGSPGFLGRQGRRQNRRAARPEAIRRSDEHDAVEKAPVESRLAAERAGDFPQRAILQAHLDGRPLSENLGIDGVAVIYRVHRATAARRIRKTTERLLGSARDLLSARLRADRAEISSMLRLIESRIGGAFQRALA